MNPSMMSFLPVLLIEGICAVASYLKNRLMKHMHQRDNDHDHDSHFGYDPEFE